MTFEQWWLEHTSDEDDPANLVRRFGVGGVIFLKPVLANVWNAALDAGIAEVQPIDNKILLENLKVNS
jgi:hypothetical protein